MIKEVLKMFPGFLIRTLQHTEYFQILIYLLEKWENFV